MVRRMNCDRCPHMAAIRNALAPCQVCEAGKAHGQVNITPQTADWAMSQRVVSDHTQRDGVTALDADTEDKLRKVMATINQLDPIEQLLVHHAMEGGSYADFDAVLAKLWRRLRSKEAVISGKKRGFRQLAHTWGKSIKRKAPELACVLPVALGDE